MTLDFEKDKIHFRILPPVNKKYEVSASIPRSFKEEDIYVYVWLNSGDTVDVI